MTEKWEPMWACIECGNIHENPHYEFCDKCGASSGHEKVKVKLKYSFFKPPRVIEVRSRRIKPTAFHRRLAKILEIEIDGGDCAASYVADAIAEALQGDGNDKG